MISEDEHYAFLKEHRKHERFEGRNDGIWGLDYSKRIAGSCYQTLKNEGYSLISKHESSNGKSIWFDRELNILNEERRKLALRGYYA